MMIYLALGCTIAIAIVVGGLALEGAEYGIEVLIRWLVRLG